MDQDVIEAGGDTVKVKAQCRLRGANQSTVCMMAALCAHLDQKVGYHTFKCPLTAAWMQALLPLPTRKLD